MNAVFRNSVNSANTAVDPVPFCFVFFVFRLGLWLRRGLANETKGSMGQRDLNGADPFANLTAKQREVLDLLLEYKTSKEIARHLRISHHTVDQRIQFAKDKLGASTRSEAAVAYRRLLQLSEGMTYEDSGIAAVALSTDDAAGDRASATQPNSPNWTGSNAAEHAEADYQMVQGIFDGRFGTLTRLGAIFAIAVLLVLLVLGALGILTQLSQLMAR